jgi:hypothetical protein
VSAQGAPSDSVVILDHTGPSDVTWQPVVGACPFAVQGVLDEELEGRRVAHIPVPIGRQSGSGDLVVGSERARGGAQGLAAAAANWIPVSDTKNAGPAGTGARSHAGCS